MIKLDPGGDRSWSGALKSGKRGELLGLTNSAGWLKGDCVSQSGCSRGADRSRIPEGSQGQLELFISIREAVKSVKQGNGSLPKQEVTLDRQLQDRKSCCSPCWRQGLLLVDQRNIFPPNPFPGWTRQGHWAPNSLFSSALPALLLQGSPAQVEGKVGVLGRSLVFS